MPGKISILNEHIFLNTQLHYLLFIILGNFMQKSAAREREEEKRRLQAEMRRREQELLSKIKDQQRELESMKQEKGKVIFMILFLTLLLENLNECHKIN
mgnify:CR=1 FL=1